MTTAASLAERVTTVLIASSTVIVSLGFSPSLMGACVDACVETCRRVSRLSFFAFSHALKHMEVGTAYAVFSALGTALMASVGILWFNEPATALKIVGVALGVLTRLTLPSIPPIQL